MEEIIIFGVCPECKKNDVALIRHSAKARGAILKLVVFLCCFCDQIYINYYNDQNKISKFCVEV